MEILLVKLIFISLSFNFSNDFDRPFSDLGTEDRAWLMTKVWAHLKVRNLRPVNPAPPGYMPPSNSTVYQVWSVLREHASTDDFNEASNWWVDTGFATEIEGAAKTESPNPGPTKTIVEFPDNREKTTPTPVPAVSEREIVDHFLHHSGPLTDAQTVLLVFRWFEMETSEVGYQAGHFRAELDRRNIAMKNVDSTLNSMVNKGWITCISTVPRKTYSITEEGKKSVESLLALCPDIESEPESLIS